MYAWLVSCSDAPEAGGRPAATPGGFTHGLRQGWITVLQDDPAFARWFAHAYAGVDPD